MSDRNVSGDFGRQKRTRFAAPAAPSKATVKQNHGALISAACDHINFHAVTLHDKLAKTIPLLRIFHDAAPKSSL